MPDGQWVRPRRRHRHGLSRIGGHDSFGRRLVEFLQTCGPLPGAGGEGGTSDRGGSHGARF